MYWSLGQLTNIKNLERGTFLHDLLRYCAQICCCPRLTSKSMLVVDEGQLWTGNGKWFFVIWGDTVKMDWARVPVGKLTSTDCGCRGKLKQLHFAGDISAK